MSSLRDSYTIKSNRESGYGRYDVMLIPKDKAKQYETELRQTGIQSVLKLGLAFRGKDVAVVSE